MKRNVVDDRPVDLFVVVHGNIPETNGLVQLNCEVGRDDACRCQGIEGLTHGIGRRHLHAGNEVRADIYRQLHRPCEIERDDILKIRVSRERCRVRRTLAIFSPDARPRPTSAAMSRSLSARPRPDAIDPKTMASLMPGTA